MCVCFFAVYVKNTLGFVQCGFIICRQKPSYIFNRCSFITLLHLAEESDFIRSVCPQTELLCERLFCRDLPEEIWEIFST